MREIRTLHIAEEVDYRSRYDEALSKAFAAGSPEVRDAYLDLASFYRLKMEEPAEVYPVGPDHRFWVIR